MVQEFEKAKTVTITVGMVTTADAAGRIVCTRVSSGSKEVFSCLGESISLMWLWCLFVSQSILVCIKTSSMICLCLSLSWSVSGCLWWSVIVSVYLGLLQGVSHGLSLSCSILVCVKASWMVICFCLSISCYASSHLGWSVFAFVYPGPSRCIFDSLSLSQSIQVCRKVSWMVCLCLNLSLSMILLG